MLEACGMRLPVPMSQQFLVAAAPTLRGLYKKKIAGQLNKIKSLILVIAGSDWSAKEPDGLSEIIVLNVHMINWYSYT